MVTLFPNETLLRTKHFTVSQDWETPIVGFFIIAANRNIKSIIECTEEERHELTELIHQIRKGLEEVLKIKEVYLFQNEDSKRNFHIWLFPRHLWMEQFGRKIESVKPIMQYAEQQRATTKDLQEVKKAVGQMREWMKKKDHSW